MPTMTLKPGESAVMEVLPGVAIRVTNDGWTLKVQCEGGDISIGLVNSREIFIGTKNSPEAVDKFLGIEQ